MGDITMDANIALLDVVAILEDLPERGLRRGQVGTVGELLAEEMLEVEFSDNDGRAYAFAPLRSDQVIVLHYQPDKVA